MNEIEITESLDKFRETARHLWNTRFQGCNFELSEQFDAIESALFQALVLYPIGKQDNSLDDHFLGETDSLQFIKLIPDGDCLSIMISRGADDSGCWDHPITRLKPEEADLRFVDFFDWGNRGHRDWKYYLAKIINCDPKLDVKGHYALIETHEVKVVAVNDAA